ncbi:MAG: sensor histidine kinase [Sandaracinobacteroides sp.]
MNFQNTSSHRWRLSTQVVAALALAMLPMGVLAVLLAAGNFAAIGKAPPTAIQALGMALPIMMWLAALLTGWFAVHRLIVEPLAAIQRLITEYRVSSDPVRTGLRLGEIDHGSVEIATLAVSFDRMADAIDAHSAELRDALAGQQRLAYEVHHRVKNNLQIVSSLLSLQARAADSPEVLQTYAVIQARIQALTQVHRWMYDDATSHGVDLRALVGDLCAGLEASLVSPAHPQVTITCGLDAIIIHPDVAVPVAFLVTELASLAAQTAAPGLLAVQVSATKADDRATLAIASAGFLATDQIAVASQTPTARIVHGMARQLRSVLAHDPVAGAYSVSFAALSP